MPSPSRDDFDGNLEVELWSSADISRICEGELLCGPSLAELLQRALFEHEKEVAGLKAELALLRPDAGAPQSAESTGGPIDTGELRHSSDEGSLPGAGFRAAELQAAPSQRTLLDGPSGGGAPSARRRAPGGGGPGEKAFAPAWGYGQGEVQVVRQPACHSDDCLLDDAADVGEDEPDKGTSAQPYDPEMSFEAQSQPSFSAQRPATQQIDTICERPTNECLDTDEAFRTTSSNTVLSQSPSGRKAQKVKHSSMSALIRQATFRETRSRWQRWIDGPFDQASSFLIAMNVMSVFTQLQYQGYVTGVDIGAASEGAWPDLEVFFMVVEHAFNVWFILELVVRLVVERFEFFYNEAHGFERFNLFDMVLVVGTSIDLYVRTGAEAINFGVLRPFRFLRLLRTLRVLQSVKIFEKLKVLVTTVAASFMALFWSILLLTIVMVMAALFLCQSLHGNITDEALSFDTRLWIFEMYGTSARAVYTVFELTFSGGWPNYARRLVEEVSAVYAVFFMIYIVSVVFAMFRIITALFLRDTLAVAASDAEYAIQQRMRQSKKYAEEMLDFFYAADTSHDGFLTLSEFENMLLDDKVKTWLSIMDIDVLEAGEFFNNLAGDDGLVSPEEFVQGILRCKGGARSQDVVAILRHTQKITSELSVLRNSLNKLHFRNTPN